MCLANQQFYMSTCWYSGNAFRLLFSRHSVQVSDGLTATITVCQAVS
jgi:hypothetical protein